MNRCRRCATVISGAITAGVLFGGVGVVAVTPAGADPAASADSAGTDAAATGGRNTSNATGERRPRARSSSPMQSGPAVSDPGAGRGLGGRVRPAPEGAKGEIEDEIAEQWPCHWLPFIEPVRPPVPAGVDNGSWLAFPGPVAVTAPVAQLAGGVAPALPGLDLALAPPAARSAAAAATPAAAAVVAPEFVPPEPSSSAPAEVARPAAVPLAGPPSRASGPPPLTRPAASPPEAVRLGYPEYLRQATMTELASVALPGLAAILGLTALEGLLGYRQAKAGYLLPAAGAGRFLR